MLSWPVQCLVFTSLSSAPRAAGPSRRDASAASVACRRCTHLWQLYCCCAAREEILLSWGDLGVICLVQMNAPAVLLDRWWSGKCSWCHSLETFVYAILLCTFVLFIARLTQFFYLSTRYLCISSTRYFAFPTSSDILWLKGFLSMMPIVHHLKTLERSLTRLYVRVVRMWCKNHSSWTHLWLLVFTQQWGRCQCKLVQLPNKDKVAVPKERFEPRLSSLGGWWKGEDGPTAIFGHTAIR